MEPEGCIDFGGCIEIEHPDDFAICQTLKLPCGCCNNLRTFYKKAANLLMSDCKNAKHISGISD